MDSYDGGVEKKTVAAMSLDSLQQPRREGHIW